MKILSIGSISELNKWTVADEDIFIRVGQDIIGVAESKDGHLSDIMPISPIRIDAPPGLSDAPDYVMLIAGENFFRGR